MTLTRTEVAAMFGICLRTLERWDAADPLPCVGEHTRGQPVLYYRDAAIAWLKARPWMYDRTSRQTIAPICPKCHRRRGACPHRGGAVAGGAM